MAKSPKGVWLFLLCLLLASCSQPSQTVEPPKAANGLLDLQGWDFEQRGLTSLSGEWEFFWQELLSPSQIESASNPLFVPVPDSWTNYEVNGITFPAEGYATYHLSVKLPKTSQVYGLYIDGEGTAYSLWVDGKLIAQNGHVATDKQTMIPQSRPQAVFFEISGDVTDFVVQISNFQHRKAGFRNEFLVGLPAQIHEYQSDRMARDTFIMGIYLVIVLYHLAIYWFRPVNISALYFALWGLLYFIRTGLLNQKLLVLLLPAMSWSTALRLEYLTFYLVAPIYALFIQALYPKDVPRWAMRVIMGFGISFSIYMLLVDTLSASYTVTPYQIILLIEMFYFIYFIGRILVRKREGAFYVASASAIGFTGIVLEILSLQKLIPIQIDGTGTFLAFVIIQAILLSDRLSKSFHRVEVLSKQLEETNFNLTESEKKYRSIFEESKEMIFIAGLDTRIKDANPASQETLGYTQDELRQMKMSDLVVNYRDREEIEHTLRENAIVKDYQLELRRKDGTIFYGLVTVTVRRDESGNPVELQGTVHDISSRMEAEIERMRAMEFEQLAFTDPLTNIYNRRIFEEIASKEWERARRSRSVFTVVLIDIDHFKSVNDNYGHLIGDRVLVNLANLCLSNMRSMDVFARYGGEEFVILMPDADQASAHQTMERLRKTVEKTPLAKYENTDILITISAGIATWIGQEPTKFNLLLEQADQALYTSKETGRNRVTVWKPS